MSASASPAPPDPYDLARFVDAQNVNYPDAILELRNGKKVSHWMWYVFPQIHGLGSSAMSHRYSIKSEAEARAYLADPVLCPRLRDCTTAVLATIGQSAREIFGTPDDMKLRSSMTLFGQVSDDPVFQRILGKYFDGKPDDRTLQLLQPG